MLMLDVFPMEAPVGVWLFMIKVGGLFLAAAVVKTSLLTPYLLKH